ncbi:hypothetical protein [Burkholderia vietnamiensis]|uniref:hypothetical protein n=1 Tax=Burkholderia vietnamiensis TaxID=60552 RepID=UPI001CF350BA|nr:hypothetical protein [Burkholderia vietnamiensis]MCA8144455.1 hypothetical protein [Burkholderia vietnamiensis]
MQTRTQTPPVRRSYTMLDGIWSGLPVSDSPLSAELNGLQCTESEAQQIHAALTSGAHAIDKRGDITTVLNPADPLTGTAVNVTLRRDLYRADRPYFLNINGNPTSLHTGSNVFTDELALAPPIRALFHHVLDALKARAVDTSRLAQLVDANEIFINSLTFAAYTVPLPDPQAVQRLICYWYAAYETRMHSASGAHTSLLQELRIERATGQQYRSSIDLDILDNSTKPKTLIHLCAYSKTQELRNKAPYSPRAANNLRTLSDADIEDLSTRIRLDVTASNRYLKDYVTHGETVTLKALMKAIRRNHPAPTGKESLRQFVAGLLDYVESRTCLRYMLDLRNPFATEHTAFVTQWRGEYKRYIRHRGRRAQFRFSPELQQWADANSINLAVSPDAHYRMKAAQYQWTTATEENYALMLSGRIEDHELAMRNLASVSHLLMRGQLPTNVTALLANIDPVPDLPAPPDPLAQDPGDPVHDDRLTPDI